MILMFFTALVRGGVYKIDIYHNNDLPWIEVDFAEGLEKAESMFIE